MSIRFFAIVLSLMLLISSLPAVAFAEEANNTAVSMTEGDVIASFAQEGASCSSSDPSVAWVDENGTLNALKPGTATVTVESEEAQQSYEVTVSDYQDGTPVVGNLKLLARFNDSMQFYDGHVYLLFTSYQDGVTINVPDLYAGYEINSLYYDDIREDIANGSNHSDNDAEKYFTFNKDMKSVTLNRGEIVTIGMYRDFDLSVPQAALGSLKNSSAWTKLVQAGKTGVIETVFRFLESGNLNTDEAVARVQAVLDEVGVDYNKALDGVVPGGVCFNRELYNQKLEWDQYENVTYEMDITGKQLATMTAYLGGNLNKFSILKNSCATVALRAWNAAVGTAADGEPNAYYLTSTGEGIFSIIDAPKGVRDSIKNRLPGYYLNNAEGVAEPGAGYQDDTGWVYVSAPEQVAPVNYVYGDDQLMIDDFNTNMTSLVNAAKAGSDVFYNKEEQTINVSIETEQPAAENGAVIDSIRFSVNDKIAVLDNTNMPENGVWFKWKLNDPVEGEFYYVVDADEKALASEYDSETGYISFRADSLPQSFKVVSGSDSARNIFSISSKIPADAQIAAEVYYKNGDEKVVIDSTVELESGTKIYVKPVIADTEISYALEGIFINSSYIFNDEHYDAEEGAYFGYMPECCAMMEITCMKLEAEAVKNNIVQVFVGDKLEVDEYVHLHTAGDKYGYFLDEMYWDIIHDENGALEFDGKDLKAVKEGSALIWARAKKNENIGVPYMVEVYADRSDCVAVTFNGEAGDQYVLSDIDENGENKVIPYSGYMVKKGTEVNVFPNNIDGKAVLAVLCNGQFISHNKELTGPCIASIPADTDLDIAVTFADAEIANMPKEIKLSAEGDTYQLEPKVKYSGLLGLLPVFDDAITYRCLDERITVDENGLITVTGDVPDDGAVAYVTAYAGSSDVSAVCKVTLGNYKGDEIVGRLTIHARRIDKGELVAHGAITFTTYEDVDLDTSYYEYYRPNDKYNDLMIDYENDPEKYNSDPALYSMNELGLENRESYFDVLSNGPESEPAKVSLLAGESITISNYGFDDFNTTAVRRALENSALASSSEEAQELIRQLKSYSDTGEFDGESAFDSLVATLVQIYEISRATGVNPANGHSEGGMCVDRELYNQFRRNDTQLPNNYYTIDITADEFARLKEYLADPENNYYSLMVKNCATGAVDIWNTVLFDKPELKLSGNLLGFAIDPQSLYFDIARLTANQKLDGEGGTDFYPRTVRYTDAVSAVIEQIKQIGKVEKTDECREKLDAAREAFEALSETEQERVWNRDALDEAEQAYDELAEQEKREEYEAYKAASLQFVDMLVQEDDSEASKVLVSVAKAVINIRPYDPSMSLDENKTALDTVALSLAAALDTQRYYEHPLLGDIDVDREVTIADATLIQRNEAWMLTPIKCTFAGADVDGDGEITLLDATALQYWLAESLENDNIGKPIP